MKTYLLYVMIIVCSGLLIAQSPRPIKEWYSKNADSEITLKLWSAHSNTEKGGISLSFDSDNSVKESTAEEVRLLGQALDEMPSLGYDPHQTRIVTIWLQNTQYQAGVGRAIAGSGKWKHCVGRKYCHEAEVIADQYLKSVDAFKWLDPVLSAHGLARDSVRVDDMGVGGEAGRISCSGLIVIALAPKI